MHIQWSVVAGLLAGTATATSADFCGTGPSSFALRDVVLNHPNADRAVRGAGCDISVDTFVHVIGASDKVEDGYITVSCLDRFGNMRTPLACLLTRCASRTKR